VSPYAVRLKTSSVEHVGRIAGNLYAISTVASVASALVTGFFLIPSVGVHRLVVLIALVLLATSLLVVERRAKAGAAVVSALLFVGVLLLPRLPSSAAAPGGGVLAVEQSPYAEIRVLEKPLERFLLIDGGIHTWVATDTWRPLLRYAAAVNVMKFFFDAPGRLLVVGLGGASVVKEYARDGWKVDAVEIDPVVIRVARRDFHLADGEARIFEMDGRRFLSQSRERYDLIIMDAFGSSSIPFHLVTREVFGLVRERLAPDGILILNVESPGWDSQLVRALGATLRVHFANVRALPTSEPPNKLGNLLVAASDRPLELAADQLGNPGEFLHDDYEHFLSVQMNHAWDNRFEPAPGGRVLTDDCNPVDIWSERINLAARKELHAMWKKPGTSW
jgi:spermidine synthase